MINKAKMGLTSGAGASVRKDPTGTRDSTGNGVQTFGETELMERSQVQGEPIKSAVIKTEEA